MKSSTRASKKQPKNTRAKNTKTDASNQGLLDEDNNSMMDIEHPENKEDFQPIPNEISYNKKQASSGFSKTSEFNLELPPNFNSYESFVNQIDPLIQQLEDYVRSDGILGQKTKVPQCDPHRAVHFTGAILQSILRFNQTGKKIQFIFYEAKINQREETLSQQALKPIFKQLNIQSKAAPHSESLTQEFILTAQEDFDPFTIYDEKNVLNEFESIIKAYESIFTGEDSEQRVSYFNKKFSRGELDRPKKSVKKKSGHEQADADDELLRAKSQVLLSDVRRETKGSQKQFGSQTSSMTVNTGGEIEFSLSGKANLPKKCSADETKLREALIAEFNAPTGYGLHNALKAFLEKRTKRLKLSLHTAILLSIVYDLSVRRQGNEWSDELLGGWIAIANFIPFSTVSTLQILNCRYFVAKALDTILSTEIENCVPRSAYTPLQEFDPETHEANERSAKLCSKFFNLYASESLQIETKVLRDLCSYKTQLEALNKIYELLASRQGSQNKENMSPKRRNTGPSWIQLDSLMNEIKAIGEISEFAEFDYFLHTHQMALTGGLVITKSANEDDWVSPKFGRGSESSAMKNSSIKKDMKTVMQDLSRFVESPAPNKSFMNALVSPDSLGKYKQALNATNSDDLSYSFQKLPRIVEKNTAMEESKIEFIDLEAEPSFDCRPHHRMEIEEPKSSLIYEEMQEEISHQDNQREEVIQPKKTKGNKKKNAQKNVEKNERIETAVEEEGRKVKDNINALLKESKDLNETKIIKQYLNKLHDLLKKPLLSETENKLVDVEQGGKTKRKKSPVEEQVQNAKDWLQEYNQQVAIENKPIDQIKDLVEEIDSIDLRVPGMEDLIQRELELALWRSKVESALVILEQNKSIATKTKSSKKAQLEVLPFETLEKIAAKAREIRLNEEYEDPEYYELRRKLEDVQSIQQRYKSSGNELDTLRKLKEELSSSLVSFPSLEIELQHKIEFNEQVQKTLETPISVGKLTKYIKELKSKQSDIDSTLYSLICQKYDEAHKFQESVKRLSKSKGTYEYEQIKEMNELLTEVESWKIEIQGLDKLEQAVASFLWAMKVDKIRRSDQVPEMTFGEPVATDLNTSFDFFEEELDIKEMLETCQNWLIKLKTASVTQQLRADLKQLIHDGDNISILDHRIQGLFDSLKSTLHRLDNDGSTSKAKSKKSTQKYDDDQYMLEELLPTESLGKNSGIEKEDQSHRNWKKSYNQLVVDEDLENYLRVDLGLEDPSIREAKMRSIKTRLMRLLEDIDSKYEMSSEAQNLRKFNIWIKWYSEAEVCTKNLNERTETRLNELTRLKEQASEFDIPKSWTLLNQVKMLFETAEPVLKKYQNKFQDSSSSFKSVQKESVHKLIEKNKHVPLVKEAEIMREELYQTSFIDCREQIAELDKKIQNHANWKRKIDSYVKNEGQRVLQAAMEPNSVSDDDLISIEQKFTQLSSEFVCLGLRETYDEKLLEGLECQLRACLLIKKQSRRNPTVEEWKRVLEFMEANPELDPTDEKGLINRMRSEIEQAATQSQTLRNIANCEGPNDRITLDSLKAALHESQNGLVKNPDDELFVSELIQKAEVLINQFEKLKARKVKAEVNEFYQILERFKQSPIAVPEKQMEIEGILNLYNRISQVATFITMDLKTVSDILKQYENCPIFIKKADELQSKYKSSRDLYEELKITLRNAEMSKISLSYDQLEEIASHLDDLKYDFEGDLTKLKVLAFTFQVGLLQKIAKEEANGKNKNQHTTDCSVKLTPQAVKTLADYGHKIQNSLKGESKALESSVKQMDLYISKSKQKKDEILEITNLTDLKKIQPIMFGFIDLHEVLDEKKLKLTSEKPVKILDKKSLLKEVRNDLEENKISHDPLDDVQYDDMEAEPFEKPRETQKINKPKTAAQPNKKEIKKPNLLEDRDDPKESVSKNELSSTSPSRSPLHKNEHTKVKEDLFKPLKDRSVSEKTKPNTKASQKETSKRASDSAANEDKKSKKEEKTKGKKQLENEKETSKPKPVGAMKRVFMILKDHLILSLDDAYALSATKRILKFFPILQKSPEKLERFANQLNKILEFPNICQFLSERALCPKQIFKLLTKSQVALERLEDELEKTCQYQFRKPPKLRSLIDSEDLEYQVMRKKVKSEQNSKAPNAIDSTISDLSKGLEQSKNSSALQKLVNVPESDPVESALPKSDPLPEESATVLHYSEIKRDTSPTKSALKSQFENRSLFEKPKPKSVSFQMEMESSESDWPIQEAECRGVRKSWEADRKKAYQSNSSKRFEKEPKDSERIKRFSDTQNLSSYPRKEKPKPALKIPPGSVLKIFNGAIKGVEEVPTDMIGLYTCDPADKVQLFPKILADDGLLRIQGRMDLSKFEPYFNKFLTTWDEKKDHIISGWAESSDQDCQESCNNMALRFWTNQKVGMVRFYDCAKIFLLHEKQLRSEWLHKLNFQKKSLTADSISTLYYVFFYRPANFPFDRSELKKIVPEVVVPFGEVGIKMSEIKDPADHTIGLGLNSDEELELSLAEGLKKQLEENLSFQERSKLPVSRHMSLNTGKSSKEKKLSASPVRNNVFHSSKFGMEAEEDEDTLAPSHEASEGFPASPEKSNDGNKSIFGANPAQYFKPKALITPEDKEFAASPEKSDVETKSIFGQNPSQYFKAQVSMTTDEIWDELLNEDLTPNKDSQEDQDKSPAYELDSLQPSRDPSPLTKEPEMQEESGLSEIDEAAGGLFVSKKNAFSIKEVRENISKKIHPTSLFSFFDDSQTKYHDSAKQKSSPFAERTNNTSLASGQRRQSSGNYKKSSLKKYNDMELENEGQGSDHENLFHVTVPSFKKGLLDESYKYALSVSDANRKSDLVNKNSLMGVKSYHRGNHAFREGENSVKLDIKPKSSMRM